MTFIKAYFPAVCKNALTAGPILLDMTYGERLAKAMELARLGDKDARAKLAAALGISVQAVGQVLTGKTKSFSADTSAKAARFLKVDHFWLATGEGEPRQTDLSEEARAFAVRYDRLNHAERMRFSALLVAARDGVPDEEVERNMPITAKKARQYQNQ